VSFADLLDQRVTIVRATEVLSVTGVATRTWTTIATAVPFVIEQSSGGQLPTDAGRIVDVDAVGFCGPAVDIVHDGPGDRILTAAGAVYDVLRVETIRGNHKELRLALAPTAA